MIIEGIITVITSFLELVVTLIPTRQPPNWMGSMDGALGTVWQAAAGLGAWLPWSNIAAVVQAVIACMAIGLLIRLGRLVLSLFTGGGGSAA